MHESTPRSGQLEVSLVPEPPCLLLALRGELDLCSVVEVPQDGYWSRGDLTTVLVDLGELSFCDGTGLRSLLAFARIHRAQGRSVSVVRANPLVWRVMRLCGVTDQLEVVSAAYTSPVARRGLRRRGGVPAFDQAHPAWG